MNVHTVIVLTDRGLYSPKLFCHIRKMRWHPFMRINANGTFCPTDCPTGERVFRPITSFARKPGEHWQGTGIAFKSRRIPCTLLAYWGEEHKEVWFILTDLPPDVINACWYGMRAWIEQGFRTIKRGGWQWHGTRMTDPKRAERLWLAVSVATLWLLSVGGEAEAEAEAMASIPEGVFPDIVDCLGQCAKPRRQRKEAKLRLVSVFRRGWITILVSLIRHEPLPLGRFIPEPWLMYPYKRSKPLQYNCLGDAA
ncbi:transposase [Candidatus Poribacteria bacterium]